MTNIDEPKTIFYTLVFYDWLNDEIEIMNVEGNRFNTFSFQGFIEAWGNSDKLDTMMLLGFL